MIHVIGARYDELSLIQEFAGQCHEAVSVKAPLTIIVGGTKAKTTFVSNIVQMKVPSARYDMGLFVETIAGIPAILEDMGILEDIEATINRREWPEKIGFLGLVKKKDKITCTLCGKKLRVGYYEGQGLKWKFCKPHAILTAQWVKDNLDQLQEHASLARAKKEEDAKYRAAKRVEDGIKSKWADTEHYSGGLDESERI